ncbi:MAG: hypothetical protein M1837_001484 [Sclerophora amabilis]|nr:MAG: hypothetical protein M1837_001484 [Sclerophora amabilis]
MISHLKLSPRATVGPASPLRRKTPSPAKSASGLSSIHFSPEKRQLSRSVDEEPSPSKKPQGIERLHPVTLSSASVLTFDFDLVKDGSPRNPSSEEIDLLFAAFPGSSSIGVGFPYLNVHYGDHELPLKPWPVFAAGLPLCITGGADDPWDSLGFTTANVWVEVSPPPIKWTALSIDTIDAMYQMYLTRYQTKITAVEWYEGFLVLGIEPEEAVELSKLPTMINKVMVRYHKEPLERIEAAPRRKVSTNIDNDDTLYDLKDLRPGVMLSSGSSLPNEMLTTSGLALADRNGSKFITGASHGLGAVKSPVYHPNAQGMQIGTVAQKLGTTDIALISLEQSCSYSNEPFRDEQEASPTITQFADPHALKRYDFVYLNSPFGGVAIGAYIGTRFDKIPDDAPEKQHWIESKILYFGNGNDRMQPGSCGSVVWCDKGHLIGFYRFQNTDKVVPHSYIVAAKVLEQQGMTIQPI